MGREGLALSITPEDPPLNVPNSENLPSLPRVAADEMLVTSSETKDFAQYSSNVTQGCSTGGWRGEGAIESGMAWWIGKQVEISVFLMLVFAAAAAAGA